MSELHRHQRRTDDEPFDLVAARVGLEGALTSAHAHAQRLGDTATCEVLQELLSTVRRASPPYRPRPDDDPLPF